MACGVPRTGGCRKAGAAVLLKKLTVAGHTAPLALVAKGHIVC